LRLPLEFIIKYNAKIFWATLIDIGMMINRNRKVGIVLVIDEHELTFGIIDKSFISTNPMIDFFSSLLIFL